MCFSCSLCKADAAQNAGRIIRALLEIALSRNWSNNAILLIDLSKAIEKRMWPYDHPLIQITTLQRETLFNLRRWADNTTINELREMSPADLGILIHMNEHHGAALHKAAMMFPTLKITHALRPLSHDLLQISARIEPTFEWDTKLSSNAEPFYVWVQDEEGYTILQWRSILVRPSSTGIDIDFVIPIGEEPPTSLSIISASDRWLGSDEQVEVSLVNLVMPRMSTDKNKVLQIPYLHISAFDDRELEHAYQQYITTLNGIQTQAFWTLYHTQSNALISAPVCSGKSFLAEAAIW
jgi:antiviral helicase SLH1